MEKTGGGQRTARNTAAIHTATRLSGACCVRHPRNDNRRSPSVTAPFRHPRARPSSLETFAYAGFRNFFRGGGPKYRVKIVVELSPNFRLSNGTIKIRNSGRMIARKYVPVYGDGSKSAESVPERDFGFSNFRGNVHNFRYTCPIPSTRPPIVHRLRPFIRHSRYVRVPAPRTFPGVCSRPVRARTREYLTAYEVPRERKGPYRARVRRSSA